MDTKITAMLQTLKNVDVHYQVTDGFMAIYADTGRMKMHYNPHGIPITDIWHTLRPIAVKRLTGLLKIGGVVEGFGSPCELKIRLGSSRQVLSTGPAYSQPCEPKKLLVEYGMLPLDWLKASATSIRSMRSDAVTVLAATQDHMAVGVTDTFSASFHGDQLAVTRHDVIGSWDKGPWLDMCNVLLAMGGPCTVGTTTQGGVAFRHLCGWVEWSGRVDLLPNVFGITNSRKGDDMVEITLDNGKNLRMFCKAVCLLCDGYQIKASVEINISSGVVGYSWFGVDSSVEITEPADTKDYQETVALVAVTSLLKAMPMSNRPLVIKIYSKTVEINGRTIVRER